MPDQENERYSLTLDLLVSLAAHFALQWEGEPGRRAVRTWLKQNAIAPQPAPVTAALGDGALVVTAARLRAALERAWLDGHSYTGTGYLSDGRFDAIVAELSGPEVER